MSWTDSNGMVSKDKNDKHLPAIIALMGPDRVVALYEQMGYKETHRTDGWSNGSAIGRKDSGPSAGVELATGMYKDHGDSGGAKNICTMMVRHMGMANYQSARSSLANYVGYKDIPDKMHAGVMSNVGWDDGEMSLAKFVTQKNPVTLASMKANGVDVWKRVGTKGKTHLVLGVPAVNRYGHPVGFAIYSVPFGAGKKFSAPFSDKNKQDKEGNKLGWVGKCGVSNLSTAEWVIKVEGVTDMLALWSLIPDHSKVAVITNLNGCNEHVGEEHADSLRGKNVVIIHDADKPGQEGASKWIEGLGAITKTIRNVTLPYQVGDKHGKDMRDWINDGLTFKRLMEVIEQTPARNKRRIRLMINRDGLEVHKTVHQVRRHMINCNVPPDLFNRGGTFAYVSGGRIRQHTKATFTITIAKYCCFYIESKDGPQEIFPPKEVASAILEYGAEGFPPLNGIMDTPVLQDDGTILIDDGYDDVGGFLVRPTFRVNGGVSPTLGDAHKAMSNLEHMLREFSFVDDASLANALALIITAVAFPYFSRGGVKTPMFGVGAAQKGSGKTYLCQLAAMLGFNSEVLIALGGVRAEDLEKKIITCLKQGQQFLLLDNAPEGKSVSSNAIAAMISTSKVTGRGAYERDAEVGTDVLWMLTGNHLAIGEDLKRRAVLIRMQVDMVDPSERQFNCTDLMGWAKKNRQMVFESVFTLIKAWHHAGRPQGLHGATMAGFEYWSSVIAGVLTLVDVPGFRENKSEVDRGSHEEQVWQEVIEAWWHTHGDCEVLMSDLFVLGGAMDDEDLDLPEELAKINAGDETPKRRSHQMGKVVSTRLLNRSFRIPLEGAIDSGNSFVDVKITRPDRKKTKRGRLWKLEKLGINTTNGGGSKSSQF